MSSLVHRLSRPRLPRCAFILDAAEVAAVELRQRRGAFDVAAAARSPIAPGLLTPSFDGQNIPLVHELATAIDATVKSAGLGRKQRWSVLLPEEAVKSFVISLETIPGTREELNEMIGWKVERMVGVSVRDLRVARQMVSAGDVPRFLVVASRLDVMAEYEQLIHLLDWSSGLIVPRFIGEAAWFDWDSRPGDKLLVGSRGATSIVAIVRQGELVLVRSVNADPERIQDEIYRVALFYRDRVASGAAGAHVSSILSTDQSASERVSDAVADALGTRPAIFDPIPSALAPNGGPGLDPVLLAAAGLATQAWSH